jgi:hypothetical protein
MTTHLTAEQMQNYLVRRVSIDELGTIGEHLHGCRSCYQAYLAVLQTRFPIEIDFDELAGLKGWHLEGEELADYLGGRMNQVDLDYARLHLQECGACKQRVYDSSNNWPENASSKGTHEEYETPWREYLPAFRSTPSPRFRVAAALLLVIGIALVLWAVLNTGPKETDVAQDVPSETIPSQNVPEQATPPLPAPRSTAIDRPANSSSGKHTGGARNSDNREAGRRPYRDESVLLARELTIPPAIEMLDRTPAIAIRGNRASIQSFTIVRPFTTLINNDRPTFSWTTLNGATSYTVSVYDADLHLVRTSEPLIETQWLMPDRLEAGMVYTWMVTARKDGQEIIAPASPARAEFKILGKPELRKLNRMVRRTASHAARGVLYAEAGLLDEAEMEFQIHLSLRPVDERVKGLLRIVKSWRSEESYLPPSPTTTKPAQ